MASESTQTTLRAELQAAQKRIAELERALARDAHTAAAAPVSYTHLDVYKRQSYHNIALH